MKNVKRILTFILAIIMILNMNVSIFATQDTADSNTILDVDEIAEMISASSRNSDTKIPGDMNGDSKLNSADAIYLLRHTIMPDKYPIIGSGDVNGDDKLNSADAIYLLRHTIMPDKYPIMTEDKGEDVDSSKFTTIVGEFTDREIKTEESAILAVQDVAEELGLENATEELTIKSVNTVGDMTYYRLQQNYQGIPVYGKNFVVVSNANGVAEGMTRNVSDIEENISLIPTVTQEQVEKSIQEYFGADTEVSVPELSDDMLVIYDYDDVEEAVLAYKIEVGGVLVCVNAYTSDILSIYSTQSSMITTGYNSDKTLSFDVSYDEFYNVWLLYDELREIVISSWDGESHEGKLNDRVKDDYKNAIVSQNACFDDYESFMYSYAIDCYDYFSDLGFADTYDAYIIFTDDSYDVDNAFGGETSDKKYGYITIGSNFNKDAIDVFGHEYAHSITRNIIEWNDQFGNANRTQSNIITGAINEAISDIFGLLIEADIKNEDHLDWILALNENAKRSVIAPESTGGIKHVADIQMYQDHYLSGIVSHAAYLMNTKYGMNLDRLAKLWYQTLYLLPSDCNFNQLRNNMEIQAMILDYTNEEITAIQKAFNDVGIVSTGYDNTSYDNTFDIEVIGADGNAFSNCSIHIHGELGKLPVGGISYSQVFEKMDSNPLTVTLPDGRYKIYVQNNENEEEFMIRYIRVTSFRGESKKLSFSTTFEHNIVVDAAVAPTCTKTGLTEGSHCSECDMVIVKQTVLPMISHNYANGKCTMCGQMSSSTEATDANYFRFTLLDDGTYEIKAKDVDNMPANVVIPTSYNGKAVTSIGEWAFGNCTNLQSITIPDSVTNVGDYAFFQCTSLQNITIPDSVTNVGDYAFFQCTSLQNITIPDSVTSIGVFAFGNCKSLQNITIPNSVTSIGYAVFSNCRSLQNITIPNSVTSIGDSAFNHCASLQNITIPNSVTSIGYAVFSNCRSLQNITIPNSVTSIGDSAFNHCASLQSITIPDSVTSIGNRAFEGCTSLQSITIPDSVTNVGDYAFFQCTSLQSITIPDSVTSIGDSAFYNCTSLQSITIPDSVTSIGNRAFEGCTSLQSITIPDSVTSIGGGAFRSCKNLQSITIPNSVTSIGDSAFHFCESLRSITIPDGITSIGDYAFWSCYSLQSIMLPDSVTSIGNRAFGNCTNLQSITIPDGVTSIGDYAFYVTSLQSITIPDGVTSIGNSAFAGCKMQRITIPNSVTSIGNQAFYWCTNLQRITFKGTKAQWNAIEKGEDWDYSTGDYERSDYTIYCTDGNITK